MAMSYRDFWLSCALEHTPYKTVKELKENWPEEKVNKLIEYRLNNLKDGFDPDAIMDCGGKTFVCSICGRTIENEYDNSAQPINDGRCCHECNSVYVIPARMGEKVELPKK